MAVHKIYINIRPEVDKLMKPLEASLQHVANRQLTNRQITNRQITNRQITYRQITNT
jgi:hypothetical protein